MASLEDRDPISGWTLADVIVADLVGDEADTAMTVGILGPDDQLVLIDADVETERIDLVESALGCRGERLAC